MSRHPRPGTLVTVGLVIVGAALPLSQLIATLPAARRWGVLTAIAAETLRPDRWEAVAAMGQLVKPFLLVAGLVLFVVELRSSRRSAGVVALVVIMTNLTVQGVKHLPFVDEVVLGTLNPLSGHMGLATSVGLAWVAVARRRRGVVSSAVTIMLAGVGVGVVYAGWHTVPQVVCPLLAGTGWALVATGLLMKREQAAVGRRSLTWLGGLGIVCGVGLLVAASLGVSAGLTGLPDETLAWALRLAVAAVVGSSMTAVSAVVLAASAPRRPAGSSETTRSDVVRAAT